MTFRWGTAVCLLLLSAITAANAQDSKAAAAAASKRIYVVGDVRKPGIYEMKDWGEKPTVLMALTRAEGLPLAANGNVAIYLYRKDPAKRQRVEIEVNVPRILKQTAPDVELRAGDIVFVARKS